MAIKRSLLVMASISLLLAVGPCLALPLSLGGLVPHSSHSSRSPLSSTIVLGPRDDSEIAPTITMSTPSDIPVPSQLTTASNDESDDKFSLGKWFGIYFTAFLLVIAVLGVLECCLRSMKARAETQKVKREAEMQRDMQAEEHGLVEKSKGQDASGSSGKKRDSEQGPVGTKGDEGADQGYGHEFVDVKL